LFRDEFDGVLDSGWQWYKEDKANWSLTNNPGWVEIMSGSGNVGDGTMDNNLLRPAPEGNFELETKLKFTPTENFQIAGLIIMESPANFIQFGRAFCNGGPCVNDGFYVDLISGGKFTGENYATPAPAVDTVYLRLRREGNIFTAYTSENGTEWKIIGSHNADFKPVTIGVIAGQAFNSVPKPAQFDYFAIYTLP
jgi:beta-xylosidase